MTYYLHTLHSIHTTYCSNSTGSVELCRINIASTIPNFAPISYLMYYTDDWKMHIFEYIENTITVLEHFLVFSIVAYRLHLNVSVCIELHNYLSLTFRFIHLHVATLALHSFLFYTI